MAQTIQVKLLVATAKEEIEKDPETQLNSDDGKKIPEAQQIIMKDSLAQIRESINLLNAIPTSELTNIINPPCFRAGFFVDIKFFI